MNLDRMLQIAIANAELSDQKQQVGCVIFKNSLVISAACNEGLRSVKHLHPKFQRYPGSVHAEVAAIIKAKRDLKGVDMLVVRINKKGKTKMARPCTHCMKYINYVGIDNLYYTSHLGGLMKENV